MNIRYHLSLFLSTWSYLHDLLTDAAISPVSWDSLTIFQYFDVLFTNMLLDFWSAGPSPPEAIGWWLKWWLLISTAHHTCHGQRQNWYVFCHDKPLIARFMWPTWGPFEADTAQVGPMLAPWTLLSGSPSPSQFWNEPLVPPFWTDKWRGGWMETLSLKSNYFVRF